MLDNLRVLVQRLGLHIIWISIRFLSLYFKLDWHTKQRNLISTSFFSSECVITDHKFPSLSELIMTEMII